MTPLPTDGGAPVSHSASSDAAVERLLGNVLRYGVMVAAVVTVAGGLLLLVTNGGAPADFRVFSGVQPELRSISGIVAGVVALRPISIIQLGIVLLIATPVLRVALSLVAFAMRRDRTYVVVTAIVLCLLAIALLSGSGGSG